MTRILHAFGLTVMLAAFGVSRGNAASDLTADEILAKSYEAMAPPIQYRVKAGEVSSVVSIKDLGGDLGLATRVESLGPQVEQITLTTAKFAYEWWPKTGLAIDKTAMEVSTREQAGGLRQTFPAGATNRLVDSESIDGVKHYVIETTIPDALVQSLAKKLSVSRVPTGNTRSWINSATFTLRKTATPVGQFECLDITRGIDLPIERFVPPEGMAFQKVATLEEYVRTLTAVTLPNVPPPKKVVRRTVAPPIWDPEKKRWKGSAPTGWTQEEWDRKVESMPSQPVETGRSPAEPLTKKRENASRVILYGNAVLVALLAAYLIYRQWSKQRTPSASLPPSSRE